MSLQDVVEFIIFAEWKWNSIEGQEECLMVLLEPFLARFQCHSMNH